MTAPQSPPGSPIDKLAFQLCLAYVFLRYSFLHEILLAQLHVNTYLVLVVGLLGVVVVLASGGFARALRFRPLVLWLLFGVWVIVGVPFSSWIGGSLGALTGYFKAQLPLPFIVAGATRTWAQCRKLFTALAVAGLVNIVTARLFSTGSDRLNLEFGSIADPNDFAAHLLMVLPFAILLLLTRRTKFMKVLGAVTLVGGLVVAAGTASRGGMLSFAAGSLFALFVGPGRLRVSLLLALPVILIGAAAFLPQNTVDRYLTVFGKHVSDQEADGAESSTAARSHLFKRSLEITLQHPLIGVGFSEFTDFEGKDAALNGIHGAWQGTHNGYTEVSSETGIVGLMLFVGSIAGCFGVAYRVYRRAGIIPQMSELKMAAFCLMLSMVCFLVAMAFLTQAYSMYVPGFIGLCAALEAGYRQVAETSVSPAAVSPVHFPAAVRKPRAPLTVGPWNRPEPGLGGVRRPARID